MKNENDTTVGFDVEYWIWWELPKKAEAVLLKNGKPSEYYIMPITVSQTLSSELGGEIKYIEYAIIAWNNEDEDGAYTTMYPITLLYKEAKERAMYFIANDKMRGL